MESISLDEYIRKRAYYKNETYTQTEVIDAINNLVLVQTVTELPTENIRDNQLYLVLNDANLPDEEMNMYDLFIHANNRWEQIDSLEFKISNYPTKPELTYLLSLKADINHGHDVVDVALKSDGFIAWEQQEKLNGIEEGANKVLIDTTPTQNSTNAISSGSVYIELSKKANKQHDSTNTEYGVGSSSKYGHVKAGNTTPAMDNANGSIGLDNGLYARADHVHPTDTSRASTSVATSISAGLMSASDKSKLDGIVIDDTLTSNNNLAKNSAIINYIDESIGGISIDKDDLLLKLNNIITEMRGVE